MEQPTYNVDTPLSGPRDLREYLTLDDRAKFEWESSSLVYTDFPLDPVTIGNAWLRYRLREESIARYGAPSFRKEDIPVADNDETVDSALDTIFETFSKYATETPSDESVVLFFLFHKRNPYIIRRTRSSENSSSKFMRITIDETESVAHGLHQLVHNVSKIPVAPETLTIGVVAVSDPLPESVVSVPQ